MPAEAFAQPNALADWALRLGKQRFYQPSTLVPHMMNAYGWIPVPKGGDLLIDLYSIPPGERRSMYWFYELIATQSTSAVRMSLEGNTAWDATKKRFDPTAWQPATGYVVSAAVPHRMTGAMIKTAPGEALRLRVFAGNGNTSDFYFKWVGWEIPGV